MKLDTRAGEVIERKNDSLRWMETNYYSEFAQVLQSFRCERDPEKDDDGNDDPTQTSIGTPLTTAWVNRATDRVTAQIPNLRFRSKDRALGERISRTLMYNWDRGHVQRTQKRHVRQAKLYGWSVRPWYWCREEFVRRRRVDPIRALEEAAGGGDTSDLQLIEDTYGVTLLGDPGAMTMAPDPEDILTELLTLHGRGGMLPVTYSYKGYVGPKCDFASVADCFPEPQFESIQASKRFIIERRRNREWIEQQQKLFPDLAQGLQDLIDKYKNGTPPSSYSKQSGGSGTGQNFRSYAARAYNSRHLYDDPNDMRSKTDAWTITEEHETGNNGKLRMVGEDDIWIGEIDYPYSLDGKIAFTECIFIDDMFGGVGESLARFMRGLQALHDRNFTVQSDLYDTLRRPLIGTNSRELFDDPSKIKRGKGFRLVWMRSANDMWQQGEQAALAAAAASAGDESAIMRNSQMLTGETNMSQAANVDPQQGRTATGARIMAYASDILTKGMVDMFTQSSLIPDAEMMYLLNRSEMDEPLEFEASRYNRNYQAQQAQQPPLPGEEPPPPPEDWVVVEPRDFQQDGEITAEVGSTLADDDERKVQMATSLYQMLGGRPDINQQTLIQELLIAHGKGPSIGNWLVPQGPPPPPPPPPVKASVSLALKGETLSEQAARAVLGEAGIELPPGVNVFATNSELVGMDQPGAAPPMPAPPMAGPPGAMPPPNIGAPPTLPKEMINPMPPPTPGAGMYDASRGRNPLA